jgi:para-nitrobenzyl esterase
MEELTMKRFSRLATVAVLGVVAVVLAACDIPKPAGDGVVRYRDVVFTSVSRTADIQYGSAPDLSGNPVALKMDMYQPAGDTVRQRPAVIFVHGGSFSAGDKASGPSADLAGLFPKLGYVAFSINYRLLGSGCTGSTAGSATCTNAALFAISDAQAAVRWVRQHADQYGVDPGRVGIGGESAGGIAATGVGLLSENPGAGGNGLYSDRVQGFFSISGGLPNGVYASADDAPGLLVHGTADNVVPYQWSVDTTTALQKVNRFALLRTIDGAGHVPWYEPYRSEMTTQAEYFFYYTLDLAHAPGQSAATRRAGERQMKKLTAQLTR